MARCLTCGRRFAGSVPPCGHEPQPEVSDISVPSGMAAAPDIEIPGYRIGNIIGTGGFGVVLAAIRDTDQRAVAIKVVHRSDSGADERLRLEARALQAIGPPHVPELYEVGALASGSPYFVFEYLTSPSLDARLIEAGGPMDTGTFTALADAILVALAAAHDRGFIHRDFKPENIFVREEPLLARLIDFGIAKEVDSPSSETTVGLALGTPEYMSPEQCEARGAVDLRADIYAAGVVMYEMLTGRPPFFGSAADVRAAHVGRRPAPPSHAASVSAGFDELILRCLAKEPARRFDSVAALRQALAESQGQHVDHDARAARPRRQQTSPPTRQTRPMGLLFLEATADTGRVKQALSSLGGQLAAVDGARCAAMFGLDTSGNPVQRALDSAQALISQNLCTRALVDHERVRVRPRPDGTVRVVSTAFHDPERYPRDTDPPGLLFTPAAIEVLPHLHTARLREGVLREIDLAGDPAGATLVPLGAGELVGRTEAFESLEASARRAIEEAQPTIATVLSEVGQGKSHLCAAVLLHLRRSIPGAQVIQLRAREPIGGESNATLGALLRGALKLPRTATQAMGHAQLVARVGAEIGDEVWPAVAMTMGWLDARSPEVRKFSAAPAALRSASARAAGEALRAMASAPVLCVIDDVHFADETTLDALEYATLAEHRAPLWVCVLGAPSFASARPAWARRAARADHIELGPLDADSAGELCRRLLRPAENVSQEAVERIVAQTRGNPLLLVELARGIKRHGLIRRRGRGDAWFLAVDELGQLPDLPKVEWLAERELTSLPPELVAHARLVAQLSADFRILEVEGVLAELEAKGLGDTFPLDAKVGIKRLVTHGLLITHRDASYGFRHQLIRDHVAQSTPPELRAAIHQAAFRFYQEADAIPEEQRLPRLALHAAHSGLERTASALYLDLADQAAGRHSYVDAELMYSRALSMLPGSDHTRHMRAHNGRGLMRYRLSRFEDALADLDRARTIARERGDRNAEIEIILDEATVLDWMLDFRKSKALVEEAAGLAGDRPSPLIEARLRLGQGRAHMRFHQWQDAIALFRQAADQAEPLGDAAYETLVVALLTLGLAYSVENQREDAQAIFERVIGLCEERGDKVYLASALNNRFAMWVSHRDVERAARDGLRCRQIGREIGMSEIEFISSYNLAELYYYAGDLDAAEPHLRRAIELEPSNSRRPLSLLLAGRVLAYAGKLREAADILDRIAAAGRDSDAAADADATFIESEEMLHEMVKLAVQEAPLAAWRALRERAEAVSRPEELAEMMEIAGLVALRQGRAEDARALLEDAIDACQRTSHVIEERIHRALGTLPDAPAS